MQLLLQLGSFMEMSIRGSTVRADWLSTDMPSATKADISAAESRAANAQYDRHVGSSKVKDLPIIVKLECIVIVSFEKASRDGKLVNVSFTL